MQQCTDSPCVDRLLAERIGTADGLGEGSIETIVGFLKAPKSGQSSRLHERSVRECELNAKLTCVVDHLGRYPERVAVLGCKVQCA